MFACITVVPILNESCANIISSSANVPLVLAVPAEIYFTYNVVLLFSDCSDVNALTTFALTPVVLPTIVCPTI